MTVFSVDTESMGAASAATQATMARLQSESNTLLGQLTQLQSSWTGAASGAFQSCTEQWKITQRHVEEALGSIGSALATATSQYADADQFSAGLFR